MKAKFASAVLGTAALLIATPALPQSLGGVLPPLGASLPPPAALERPLDAALPRSNDLAEGLLARSRGVTETALADVRRQTVARLLREHPREVEADDQGQPVVRGEILALAPAPEALAKALAAGFRLSRRSDLDPLGLQAVVLSAPKGASARQGLARLKAIDPHGTYELNHLYQAGGEASVAGKLPPAAAPKSVAAGVQLGLVDGGVAAGHATFRRAQVTQRLFAPGRARATDHATAVASLMVGAAGPFRGAAPGASLHVADVYGTTPAGGSAEAIAKALAWMAQSRVAVVNISLVGPPNRLLERAVGALIAHRVVVVSAVGNDGPAAAPLYPAAYPDVVAVTAVNSRRQVLPEASRGLHVDFAAPGADMAAAGAGGGYLTVRGTSFAAPLVAGLIARRGGRLEDLGAVDLGPAGVDPVYGRGLVGFDLRTDPGRVGARSLALRGP